MTRKCFHTVLVLALFAGFLSNKARAQITSTTPDGKCRYPVANWRTGSQSMLPTFDVGDVFWSICLSHAVQGSVKAPSSLDLAVSDHQIRPGDVLITHWPGRPSNAPLIKRLIGMPGDRVRIRRGILSLNGTDVINKRQADWAKTEEGVSVLFQRWRETLPDGAAYDIVFHPNARAGAIEDTEEVVVPPDSMFVLGDNRDNSVDTRLSIFGFVRFSDVIGVVSQDDLPLEHVVEKLLWEQLVGKTLLPS